MSVCSGWGSAGSGQKTPRLCAQKVRRFESDWGTHYLLIIASDRSYDCPGHGSRLAGGDGRAVEAIDGALVAPRPYSYTAPSITSRCPMGCARATRTGVSGFGLRI